LTWTIGDVTLPFAPSKVRVSNPAKVDQFVQESDLPIVIVDGAENFTITIEGVIYDTGKTANQIWADVIIPLLQKRGTIVALSTSEGDLDDSYVLASFEPARVGKLPCWTYTMRLLKGSSYVIL